MMTPDEKSAWLSARAGKLTASRMADAMGKKGPAARIKYMHELLAERLTGSSVPHVVTDPMLHGIEYEDEMFDEFVSLTGRTVRLSRLYEHPTIENFAATPDRELDDGILEGKCPSTVKYLEWKIAGVVPAEHKPQMLAQLACTRKKWCGFLAYDPRLKEPKHRLFLAKFEPTEAAIAEVEEAAIEFLAELEAKWEAFTTAAA